MNILFHGLKPRPIERYIDRSNEELLVFVDPLLLGPVSILDHYNPGERYEFWSRLYSYLPMRNEIREGDFIFEKTKYGRVATAFKRHDDVTIWLTDNPHDIFLLFILSSIRQQYFRKGRLFLGRVTSENRIYKQQLKESDIREYAACWYSRESYWQPCTINNKNVKFLSIVTESLKYLHPFYKTSKLHFAQIDTDILDEIPFGNSVSEAIVISNIINRNEWIGDLYVRARIRVLNDVLGFMIRDVTASDSSRIFLTKNKNYLTSIDYYLTEPESIAEYISKLSLLPYSAR